MELKSILFYSFALIAFIWELSVIFMSRRIFAIFCKLQHKITLLRNREEAQLLPSEWTYLIFNIIYVGWSFVGVIGSEKIEFGFLILLTMLNMKKRYLGMIFESLISLLILLVIISNKFVLHIDILAYFRHLIKTT